MNIQFRQILLFILISTLVLFNISCSSPALDDYRDSRYELINQNGETVVFPDDFQGAPLIIGFIYTHCPDICSFITANISSIHDELDDPGDTQFVLVTFDPERDTPEVLKQYAHAFQMDREPFQFLTGDPETINSFMQRMSVRTQESFSRDLDDGERVYFINHSDKILLIDKIGRAHV